MDGLLSNEMLQHLLPVARGNVERAVRRESGYFLPALPQNVESALDHHRATFVSLKNRGRLRGCLGHFDARYPLKKEVAVQAVESVTQDARFFEDPVQVDELPEIQIEISVLSPLEPVTDVESIKIGRDGIVVDDGKGRRGVYLPQVAVEHRMNREQFLSSCCLHKAGLPADAWQSPGAVRIEKFQTQVISE